MRQIRQKDGVPCADLSLEKPVQDHTVFLSLHLTALIDLVQTANAGVRLYAVPLPPVPAVRTCPYSFFILLDVLFYILP